MSREIILAGPDFRRVPAAVRKELSWLEPVIEQLYLDAEAVRPDVLAKAGAGADVDMVTRRLMQVLLAGPLRRFRRSFLTSPQAFRPTAATATEAT